MRQPQIIEHSRSTNNLMIHSICSISIVYILFLKYAVTIYKLVHINTSVFEYHNKPDFVRSIFSVHHPVVESYDLVTDEIVFGSEEITLLKTPLSVGVLSKSETWSNNPPLFIAIAPPRLTAASLVA